MSRAIVPSGRRIARCSCRSSVAKAATEDCRHPGHHHRQRLAHGDRRIDVDPAGGDQGGHQLELFGDRIEPVLDRRDLAFDDAGGAVDQQAFGRAGGARQHDDVGDARDQRQRNERQRQRRDQRQADGATRGRRLAVATAGALATMVTPAHHMGSGVPWRKDRAATVPLPQAAARIAALLTLPSTWPSNCWKFFSKRWATSRAALS